MATVDVIDCKLRDADVDYHAYELKRGGLIYASQGLGGYDSALVLGLKSLVVDQPMNGEISIATTGLGDPAAFARVQAGTLAPDKALEEAYRRNNAGSYAEAAEFFAAASSGSSDAPLNRSEALVNEALQKSNLGRFAEADVLFSKAAEIVGSDPIVARRLRNYRAIHDLNQGDPKAALAELDKPLPQGVVNIQNAAAEKLEIDPGLAKRLNADCKMGQQLDVAERRAPARRKGRDPRWPGAPVARHRASPDRRSRRRARGASPRRRQLLAVRGGKVASILWMRAQIFGDLGAIAEDLGPSAEAQRLYGQAVDLLEANYPGSAVLLNAKARLAGYLARHGQCAVAETMFSDDRPFAARHKQLAAELRQCAAALMSTCF